MVTLDFLLFKIKSFMLLNGYSMRIVNAMDIRMMQTYSVTLNWKERKGQGVNTHENFNFF
jgi:hypothetical protein